MSHLGCHTPPTILWRVLRVLFTALLSASCIAADCLFGNNSPAEPISLSLVNAGDTVPPSPTLRFYVGSPLADSSVDFVFSPATAALYSVYLNDTRDTITLSFLDMLDGNTRYVLRLKSAIHSAAGAWLFPNEDSIVIFTAACEHEPNYSFSLADTLFSSSIFGRISQAADTDVYCVPKAGPTMFFLSSFDARDTFFMFDSLLRSVPAESKAGFKDTITIPDTTRFPLFVKILSYVNGSTGKYEFGIVRK
jgi:hypothetical protein